MPHVPNGICTLFRNKVCCMCVIFLKMYYSISVGLRNSSESSVSFLEKRAGKILVFLGAYMLCKGKHLNITIFSCRQ